jgi:hypothetical protein
MAAGDPIAGERPARPARSGGRIGAARVRRGVGVCVPGHALAVLGPAVALGAATSIAAPARADDTIKRPGDHPEYHVEIEPHALFAFAVVYTGAGFGAGARFSIPIVHNGFIPSINNSIAITFGADALYFDSCGGGCTTWLDFPVAMQWNFYVARHWSVFGEPGLVVGHGFVSGTYAFPDTWVYPAIFAGGRYHITDTVSLTMRVGYPMSSFGVSFFL